MTKLDFSSRHWLACGDCVEIMRKLPDDSIDSIVTDPPYGIGFMGAEWDQSVPSDEFAKEALRLLKPGGHIIAFAATRTVHRLAVALEDAGFEIRDQIAWLTWQGFPKSLDISKSIDKLKHNRSEMLEVTTWIKEARDAAGITNKDIDEHFGFNGMGGHWTSQKKQPSVPTLEQVPELLELLKVESPPERIQHLLLEINGKKNEPGENWFKRKVTGQYSTPNGMRVYVSKHDEKQDQIGWEAPGIERRDEPSSPEAVKWKGWGTTLRPSQEPAILARKPISENTITRNVLKHGTGAINIDACRHAYGDPSWPGPGGEIKDIVGQKRGGSGAGLGEVMGGSVMTNAPSPLGRWPANIFHCPKPSVAEKGAGVEHPTVKPVTIMRWLIKMVTPPGGTVLEPFAGSGTTLVAGHADNFRMIGIEHSPKFCDLIKARLTEADQDLEAVKIDEANSGF